MPTSRERVRTKMRRRAELLVRERKATRRSMTEAEKTRFLDDVEANSPNEFGLVKLSELLVDDPIDAATLARRGRTWDASRDIGLPEGPQTLMTYAAWLGRAWIVRALLRAGADPLGRTGDDRRVWGSTVSACSSDEDDAAPRNGESSGESSDDDVAGGERDALPDASGGIRALVDLMMTRYPEAATWLVLATTRAKARAGARVGTARTAPCVACAATPPRRPLAYPACDHIACEACAWRNVVESHGEFPRCPSPGCCTTERETRWSPSESPSGSGSSRGHFRGEPQESRERPRPLDAAPPAPAPPRDGVQKGAAPWVKPPKTVRPPRPADAVLGASFVALRGSKRSFLPEPVSAAARRRVAKLFADEKQNAEESSAAASANAEVRVAALAGDVWTLRALIARGAAIDMPDENGHTPLFVAAWRGRTGAVAELLRAGADPHAAAPDGATPGAVAAARRGSRGGGAARSAAALARRLNLDRFPRVTRLCAARGESAASNERSLGPMFADDVVPEAFLAEMDTLLRSVASGAKAATGQCTDAERLMFADAEGGVRATLEDAVRCIVLAACRDEAESGGKGGSFRGAAAEAAEAGEVAIFPQMRFLRYSASGDRLAPHVDLRKSDPFACVTTGRSTHTFCLYLTTCASGGETVFMDKLRDPTDPLSDRVGVGPRGKCAPKRGRLLLFPHEAPHAGRPVEDAPKLLLRGEVRVKMKRGVDSEDWKERLGHHLQQPGRGEGG